MIQAHNKNLWLSHTKKNAHKSLHTGNLSLHFVRPFSPYRPSLYWLLPHFFLLTCVWVLAVKWSLSLFHFPFFFFTITLPFLLQHYCVTVFPHLTVLHHQLLLDFSIILNLLPPAETRLWCLICSKLSMSAAISSWSDRRQTK